ncbi:MAG: LPS export ABC transporter periplasmic protein LptC [Alphaproteobacteria bacterium]|nr:LPS export ABC transporter periplasmic protein LptC [Alphaproteobacteria bacterium]
MFDKKKLDSFFDASEAQQEQEKSQINRHTQYVRRVKIFLPVIAVFLIGLLLIIPSLKDNIDELKLDITQPKKGELEKLHVENTVFYITDANNKVSNFNTIHIDELEPKSKIVKLTQPEGTINTKSGSWINIKSSEGFFNQATNQLDFKEKIYLFFSDGMNIETSKATADFKKSLTYGNEKITGNGYLGEIDAEKGFEYQSNKKVLILKGKTRIQLDENSFKGKK